MPSLRWGSFDASATERITSGRPKRDRRANRSARAARRRNRK